MPVPVSPIDTTTYSPGESSGGAVAGSAPPQSDLQRAAFGHRVPSVDSQIEDREFELIGVDQRWRQPGLGGNCQPNPSAQCVAQQLFNAGEEAAQIDGLRIEPLSARESQQALYQRASPLGGLQRA